MAERETTVPRGRSSRRRNSRCKQSREFPGGRAVNDLLQVLRVDGLHLLGVHRLPGWNALVVLQERNRLEQRAVQKRVRLIVGEPVRLIAVVEQRRLLV